MHVPETSRISSRWSNRGSRAGSAASAHGLLELLQPRLMLIAQCLDLTGERLDPPLVGVELSCILIAEDSNAVVEQLDLLIKVGEIGSDGIGAALLAAVDFVDARG